MKKKAESEDEQIEILKAVAQAWHGHSGNTRPMKEFDAHSHCRNSSNFMSKPSRFKLEATMNKLSKGVIAPNWDFGQSLWDSYEIVTLSKKLEAGLVLDNHPLFIFQDLITPGGKRRRESKNSLRNLFKRVSS
ncbi:PREDICTED: uncharacterized protein LOC104593295 [Nelumbo nucifera]|uniref:Uncharacterized protein LOC104593295 n=1 Tax=Nelumbo nucifera TaxID=4432 RepID=A0A1U7ZSV0_NELNU|nr:PREDICTED: uncharacterized protein LOC104593295 [Nelumbo nucifera]